MKKTYQSIFAVFISSLGLFSCKTIPETVIPSNTPPVTSTVNNITPFFVATSNNSNWTATTETAQYNSGDSTVTLTALNSSGSITLTFYVKPTSTSFVSGQAIIGGATYPNAYPYNFKVNSAVNQVNTAVSGTFDNITFYNSNVTTGLGVSFAVFTNGSFIVKPN